MIDYVSTAATEDQQTPYSICNSVSYNTIYKAYRDYLTAFSAIEEPRAFVEASKDERWVAAMRTEIQALEDNGTWELVKLPPGKRPIGCKWVYKLKYKADGSIERFKARLATKGYNQKEGLDYNKTFSPIVKIAIVRLVIAIAAVEGWHIHQMDVVQCISSR
ncbi:uncharacterized mitochondrial protein AtMg00820-like [Nicotiana tomentosiformis]|uniref:uncharacterized mitochondrial protein AtMg00820-like n=1 Tax=Nicotiana tomentosiformis TaxID=4098 RepID=UPI00388CA4F7